MTREFSLVLLGSGILTAGYLAASSPEEELQKKAEEQAAKQVGNTTTSSRTGGPMIIFLHSRGYAGAPNATPMSSPNVNRGGFGAAGRAVGAGGGA